MSIPHKIGDEWETYERADGEQIFGEFEWVDGPEFFDDLDEPMEVLKKTWVLSKVEEMTFGSDDELIGVDGDE